MGAAAIREAVKQAGNRCGQRRDCRRDYGLRVSRKPSKRGTDGGYSEPVAAGSSRWQLSLLLIGFADDCDYGQIKTGGADVIAGGLETVDDSDGRQRIRPNPELSEPRIITWMVWRRGGKNTTSPRENQDEFRSTLLAEAD